MNSQWVTVMSILGVIFVIVTIVNCKICIREYKKMLELTTPVTIHRSNRIYPIPIVPSINNADNIIHTIPVATGTMVINTTENIPVITVAN